MALSIHWKTHIDAWQISGQSQAAYCRQHQLAYSTFSARLSELRTEGANLATITTRVTAYSCATSVLTGDRVNSVPCQRSSTGIACRCLCLLACGVMAISGLIEAPAQLWLAVEQRLTSILILQLRTI